MNIIVLYLMQAATGSKWRKNSNGVIWENLGRLETNGDISVAGKGELYMAE